MPPFRQVNARVLPPPHIQYGNGASVRAQMGSWNLLKVQFYQPMNLINWGVVCCLPRNQVRRRRAYPLLYIPTLASPCLGFAYVLLCITALVTHGRLFKSSWQECRTEISQILNT